jgi:hypothetical protein
MIPFLHPRSQVNIPGLSRFSQQGSNYRRGQDRRKNVGGYYNSVTESLRLSDPFTITKDDHGMIVLTIQCSDDHCCDGGASRTRAQAANSADSSWDSTTHSYALGHCKQTSGRHVSPDTGL